MTSLREPGFVSLIFLTTFHTRESARTHRNLESKKKKKTTYIAAVMYAP